MRLAEAAPAAEGRVAIVLFSEDGFALAAVAALVDLDSVNGAGSNGGVGAGGQGEDGDDVAKLHFVGTGVLVAVILTGRELRVVYEMVE